MSRRCRIGGLLVAASVLGSEVVAAQSPNAFGQPTADVPNPAASIAAVPGSRSDSSRYRSRRSGWSRAAMPLMRRSRSSDDSMLRV